MKTIFKLRSTCIALLAILVAMLSTNIEDVTEYNIKKYLDSDCVSVANYISNHVELFATKYNASDEAEGKFEATSVENKFEITVYDVNEVLNGVFLDFDGDNGYAVIVDDYNFYDFEIKGESPYKNIEADEYSYSILTGYYYTIGDERISITDLKYENNEDLFDDSVNSASSSSSIKLSNGCGQIFDLDAYVKQKYGNKWTLDSSQCKSLITSLSADRMKYSLQEYLSCYRYFYWCTQDNCFYYQSEGNCYMVSAYNLLQSIADATGSYKTTISNYKKYSGPGMPSIKIKLSYDPKVKERNTYYENFDDDGNYIGGVQVYSEGSGCQKFGGESHDSMELITNIVFPKLYCELREYAVNKYGVNGNQKYIPDLINEIGNRYGYDFKVGKLGLAGNKEAGVTSINNNLPFILSTSNGANNSGYSNHSMAVFGYKIYTKTSGWSIFKTTQKKVFYEIQDSWNCALTYFDIGAYVWVGSSSSVLINMYDKKTNPNGIKY